MYGVRVQARLSVGHAGLGVCSPDRWEVKSPGRQSVEGSDLTEDVWSINYRVGWGRRKARAGDLDPQEGEFL